MMDEITTVDALFIHQMQDLHSAESQLVDALTNMVTAAQAVELRGEFASHLEQTRQQLLRVEQALLHLDEVPGGVVCKGVEGLIAEARSLMAVTPVGAVLDNALIDSARKVEQYEITSYRSAIAKAYELGFKDVAHLLEANLQEEELADYRLQQLAEGMMPYSGPGADPRDDGSEVIVGQTIRPGI